MNRALDILTFKSKMVEKALDGEAHIIISDGILNEDLCRKEYITYDEFISSLREQQYGDIKNVPKEFLETNGKITVVTK